MERKGHAHTRTHASPASHSVYVDGPFCLRRSQPLNRPGKRNPRPLPNQATTPPSDSQRPGALPTHTCLSARLTAWEGASPTFPCPSARLTGASRQETPPAPQFMAISTSDGHGRVGASPGPVGGQGGHVPALGGPRAAALPQARLTGGGRRGPPAGPASDRASPLTHIRAVTPPAGLSGVCARVGREGRESGELGEGAGAVGGGGGIWRAPEGRKWVNRFQVGLVTGQDVDRTKEVLTGHPQTQWLPSMFLPSSLSEASERLQCTTRS